METIWPRPAGPPARPQALRLQIVRCCRATPPRCRDYCSDAVAAGGGMLGRRRGACFLLLHDGPPPLCHGVLCRAAGVGLVCKPSPVCVRPDGRALTTATGLDQLL